MQALLCLLGFDQLLFVFQRVDGGLDFRSRTLKLLTKFFLESTPNLLLRFLQLRSKHLCFPSRLFGFLSSSLSLLTIFSQLALLPLQIHH